MEEEIEKHKLIEQFRLHEKDTGSAVVQIALLTNKIQRLTTHLKKNSKDHSSRRGLLRMVNRRRKLLNYLNRTEPEKYREMLNRLSLRK
ncbi:30S ribosomal protein S15 [Candidatus Methylacidiphilum fumarolicum]|uniref:Small ribosomal subunit protein uS15 n=2 Tax=Candidatus Methylacidiphilum fumarolicum TaxID=591154 RepID=I0K0S1_METFB|nr:30S ribosomal protein S15 [Candidatus Methylacidiphilum fumarolicum]MBW6414792.1 30S ribosomal protein S15 [Candidatus Methylacidiphilum fumarolicum]TFE71415.1 30S ribosomal protein S15 [Candidatus Methylacidiphilum fumarolicum]TFE73096.1 30S ribosomal protein S15 [Candidatus Methylacidiphilum fumarolicum]CAI9084650.1 30S ribosomal subunit protein S15 [Candidatus Methylacidiphilum fumarolicum]CCG93090.1 30S ribosomal protein S15 [Methylacidiphilum fumariolicum SolV]